MIVLPPTCTGRKRLSLTFLQVLISGDFEMSRRLAVDEATRVRVPASVPSGHNGPDHREGSGVYGYHWWPNGIKPSGERKWPDAPDGTYTRSGFKNNRCFVISDWNMVIVWLGTNSTHKITDVE